MKKIFMVLVASVMVFISIAFSPSLHNPEKPKVYASAVMIAIGDKGNTISLLTLSKISRTDLEKLSGKKMNFMERLAFKGAQKKLKKAIDENGVITKKQLKKLSGEGDGKGGDGDKPFNIGGFALGFLLGLIGVLIAYLIKDEKKPSRIKWAWIGLIAWVVLLLLFFI